MVMHSSNISYGQGPYSYLLQSVITYPGGPTKETVSVAHSKMLDGLTLGYSVQITFIYASWL